jgi:4'-phosphopantetheinyl transferase
MELWLVDLDAAAPALEALEREVPRLSADDHERAKRLSDSRAQQLRLTTYVALRVVLERAAGPMVRGRSFIRSARGKPRLAGDGPAFSFSHTERLALIGVAGLPSIGVDLEESRSLAMSPRRREEILAVGSGLSGRLAGHADSHAPVLQAWCRLEAYAKARGLGISRVLTELGLREARGRQLGTSDIEAASRQLANQAGLAVHDVELPAGLHGAVACAGSVSAPPLRRFPTDVADIARLLAPARAGAPR